MSPWDLITSLLVSPQCTLRNPLQGTKEPLRGVMEGSNRCQNDRTKSTVILPPFEGVYLLNWPQNLRHQAVFKAKNDLQEQVGI